MSFVAELIIFIKYLKEKNITEIKLIGNLPVRHKAHIESNNRRLNYHKKIYNDEEYNDYKKEIERKNNQYNSVHKNILRTFYRVMNDGDNDFCNYLFGQNNKIK